MSLLSTQGDSFRMDGEPFRLLSGAMHYFRVMPEYWPDRLAKMRAFGLNTVETYVPWNLHEPRRGAFDFSGRLDIVRYIREAQQAGLYVIVRPGPYICSEWDFGGLPWWLLKDRALRVRCCCAPYLQAVDAYWDQLLERLVPLQSTRGGPVIAMQVENEYGSFGCDKAYLRFLSEGLTRRGIEVLQFTSDGPPDFMLQGGTLPGVLKTANFGSHATEAFKQLRRHQPEGPLCCMEFWNGWFTPWGDEKMHERTPEDAAAALDEILSLGGNVNFYMMHGGTNFGFMNGANSRGTVHRPQSTSYDYGAPISECGELTAKYFALREVLGKHADIPSSYPTPSVACAAYGTLALTETADLMENLVALTDEPVKAAYPLSMEELDQGWGYVLYRTRIESELPMSTRLGFRGIRDRALVYVDGTQRCIVDRNTESDTSLELEVPAGGCRLDLLVENMGRFNYGVYLNENRKGIVEGVVLEDQQFLLGEWLHYPLPMDDMTDLDFKPGQRVKGPAFYRGMLEISDEPRDTFVALPHFTKGNCWINGFNLGRYWAIGPQRTLYLPAPLLLRGRNEVIVFDQEPCTSPEIQFCDQAGD